MNGYKCDGCEDFFDGHPQVWFNLYRYGYPEQKIKHEYCGKCGEKLCDYLTILEEKKQNAIQA